MLRTTNLFILVLTFLSSVVFAQPVSDSSARMNKLQLLDQYNKEATGYYNTFKNALAFENLVKYSDLKENIFKEQAEAEINKKEKDWIIENKMQQAKLDAVNGELAKLKSEQGSLISEKNTLLRNTIIYFAIVFGLAIYVLLSRKNKLSRELRLENISSAQLFHIRKMSDVADQAASTVSDMLFSFHAMQDLSLNSKAGLSKLKSMSVTLNKGTEKITHAEMAISEINSLSAEAKLFSDHLDSMMKAGDEELKLSSLNKIIEESLQLSYHWICSRDENFNSAIVKDLEKILPDIKIMPGAVGQAMFHFFCNAFQSVLDKKGFVEKNYQPKVSVSSRKLPRFVQVRIKDNGTGISDAILPNIFKPFFTTHSPEISAGLGLSEAERIIKVKHKGEIIIETESGNGTDIIIRFPLNTLM